MKKLSDNRRNLLKFLLASPLISTAAFTQEFQMDEMDPDIQYLLNLQKKLIASPDDAINIFDLEAVARRSLPPAHYGYIATGVADERSQISNLLGYKKLKLRARRIRDVREIDTSVTIFGRKWPSPLAIAPTGHHRAYHNNGELAVARAAKNKERLMMLSNVTSTSVEEVNEARGEPVWFQLYARDHWPSSLKMIRRAEAAGCEVLILTVDMVGAGKRETQDRFMMMDRRNCSACHGDVRSPFRGRPMYEGVNLDDYLGAQELFNWDLIKRIKDTTNMKLVVKGITHALDAKLCVENGVDLIIVSNHGGRAQVDSLGTIEILPEVVAAVDGKIPVMVDGGIRRGSDIFKALALGAKAVDIGRPYLWGLGAFGQAGVEKVIDIFDAEFKTVMQQTGATSINQISKEMLTS
ncbi:alpha-hydroxy acid oxidase [Pseudemcibacter sp.]|uniref:alpha-hydroxy acid oxidase n=1 Tax=Pseudemcibacter sp. TaxID=2943293 RepID=UPI003F6A1469